jgi:hypothetical protein
MFPSLNSSLPMIADAPVLAQDYRATLLRESWAPRSCRSGRLYSSATITAPLASRANNEE